MRRRLADAEIQSESKLHSGSLHIAACSAIRRNHSFFLVALGCKALPARSILESVRAEC